MTGKHYMKTRCKTKKLKNKGMNTIKNTPVKHSQIFKGKKPSV